MFEKTDVSPVAAGNEGSHDMIEPRSFYLKKQVKTGRVERGPRIGAGLMLFKKIQLEIIAF
jgi:hypothetical protein